MGYLNTEFFSDTVSTKGETNTRFGQILDSSKNICPILEKNIIHRIFFNITYDNIIDGQ